MKKILITGGAGFIGHHVIEHILKNTDWQIHVIDKLSYSSSGLDRLRDIDFIKHEKDPNRVLMMHSADFTHPIPEGLAQEIGQVDYILHMGAETHVDNSISDPEPFVLSNVLGTMHMLQFARTQNDLKAFIYFSTDEVFGAAPVEVAYKEWDRYNSGNPYAASKASGEELALAWANTYNVPVIITHTMNVFGERQHSEKFIPKVIRAALAGETVIIHANKEKTKAGSRFWIHARNVAGAILFLLDRQELGDYRNIIPRPTYWRMHNADKYNIVGEREVDNLEMAQFIARAVGKELKYEMVDFHSSRPGHDLRYALDGSKLKAMGWELPMSFEDSLRTTIEWTLKNHKWLQ